MTTNIIEYKNGMKEIVMEFDAIDELEREQLVGNASWEKFKEERDLLRSQRDSKKISKRAYHNKLNELRKKFGLREI